MLRLMIGVFTVHAAFDDRCLHIAFDDRCVHVVFDDRHVHVFTHIGMFMLRLTIGVLCSCCI